MLNSNIKLNQKLFAADVEKTATRKGFGEGLLLAGKYDEKIVALSADLTESTQVHLFKNAFPNRFIEVGVAEQNLASVASGLAASGKIPVIASYAIFNPGRNWEQIRTTICYNNRKVVVAGSHAGLSAGKDGGSHQALEDIALARVIPNMTVISPCDAVEARKAIIAAISPSQITPVYLRLARENTPIITTDETPFVIGKAQIVWGDHVDCDAPAGIAPSASGSGTSTVPPTGSALCDIGIIATGPILYNAILAAKQLSNLKIRVKVLNLATIKPIDEEAIVSLARQSNGKILTVEEHQISGGMGSAVAEVLARKYPSKMAFIGVNDRFGQSGTTEELYKEYGLTVDDIVEKAKGLV
ncbi:MAG: transketolase C-terminal domain-containing protein [bacterium]